MPFNKLLPGLKGLSRALMHKDHTTYQHSARVEKLAQALGEAVSLEVDDLAALRMVACLHDIGKIGIPDTVLSKPTKLDANDWKLMHTHSEKGEDIILALELDHCDVIATAVRHHHEYFDGTGYPDKLNGDDIHYFARIISIVDSYDAMTFSRPYEKARTHTETMDVMFAEEGIKSDPYLFRKFTRLIELSPLKTH